MKRYTISVMLEQGYSQNDIARTIKKDKSVVSREIQRNRNLRTGRYTYKAASLRSAERKKRFMEETYTNTAGINSKREGGMWEPQTR